MVNYACSFEQSETGKYFEWIIMSNVSIDISTDMLGKVSVKYP